MTRYVMLIPVIAMVFALGFIAGLGAHDRNCDAAWAKAQQARGVGR